MRAKLLPTILLTLSVPLFAGCGHHRATLVLPPPSLATCADEPTAPDLPGREEQARRDALTLDYILGLRSAFGDCKAKVAGLAAWMETAGD